MRNKANFKGFEMHGYKKPETPKHYKSVYDVVDFLTDLPPLPFLFGDTIKRIVRLDRKGQKALDLKKIEYNITRMQGCKKSIELITALSNPIVSDRYGLDYSLQHFVQSYQLNTHRADAVFRLMSGMAGINVSEFIETLNNN